MFGQFRARTVASRVALCAALLGSTAMPAFAADVSGRVVDPASGAALPGAQVSAGGVSTTADGDGRFVLRNLPAGAVELTFSYIGYATVTRTATSSDAPVPAVFALDPPLSEARAGGDIIVTGQRAAERRALQAKKASNFIQDTLNANDVGKLPDQNVAEAVRRLPGIAVANDQGEGRYVIIRGANPNLVNVTINSQTAPAPEPEGRQVKLDDIPSSLIGSVTVVKSLTPDRDANAIAGQVDIDTLTAFDRKGRFLNARLANGYNNLNSRNPYEGDLTLGTRFGPDRTFGVVLSGNYSNRPIESENLQGSSNWGTPPGATRTLPDDYRTRDYNLTRERYGFVGNFDWRPSNAVNLYIRTLYSTFKDHETRDQFRIEIPVTYPTTNAVTGAVTQPTAAQQAVNLALSTGGAFTARGTRFLRLRNEDDSTFTGELGGKFRFGGAELELQGTYSKALKKDPLRSEFSFRTPGNALTGLTLDLSDVLFRVDTANATPYNPALFQGFRVNYDRRRAAEDLYQFRGDLSLPVGGNDDFVVKLGGKYQETDKLNDRDLQQYTLSTATNLTSSGAASDDGSAIYGGRYPFGPRINYDLAQAYYTVTNPAARTQAAADLATTVANSLVNDYKLGEKLYAGYLMATVKIARFTVVPGVRVEHVDGTYRGKAFTAASSATQDFNLLNTRTFTDVFPDINVRFDATDRLVLRAAGTTAIGRPNYADLAPYVNVTDTTANAGVVALGNPNLKPYKAAAGDLSAEYYFKGQGILSVAAFYKHLANPIFSTVLTQAGTYAGTTFTKATVTQPLNGTDATLYGVEANLQLQLLFLPGALSGFGVSGNLTYTDGSATGVPGRAGKVPNFLQSKYTGTAQLFYEKYGLNARLAYTYRSRYLDTLAASAAFDQFTGENNSLDARISYAPVKAFTLFGEASNLLDSPWRRFQAIPTQLIENEHYRQTFRVGVQLAF